MLTLKSKEKEGSKILSAWEAGVPLPGEASQLAGRAAVAGDRVESQCPCSQRPGPSLSYLLARSLYELGQMINRLKA